MVLKILFWQRKVKRRALIHFSFRPRPSAMPGDNPVHIGQANPDAFKFLSAV
jgi:hypothetical protein